MPGTWVEGLITIKEGLFEEDAIEKAHEFVTTLTMHAEQTAAKGARTSKERLFEKKKCYKSKLKK